ncbi:MAG TPA: ABC transporter permease [Thermoleophilia bacterium]|nr:ABC transporter permease [Thermoleophilia bacterium]
MSGVARVWPVLGKELLQTRRDRLAALFTFILPIVFMAFFGYLFGGEQFTEVTLGVVAEDLSGVPEGPAGSEGVAAEGAAAEGTAAANPSGELFQLLAENEDFTLVPVSPEEADAAVSEGELDAALVITEPLDLAAPSVTLIRDAVSEAGFVAEAAVRAALADIQSRSLASRAAPQGASVAEFFAQTPVELERTALGSEEEIPSGFEQSAPGMIVNWILFSLLTVAIGLVYERNTGTLARLRTAGAGVTDVLGGKFLAMVLITLVQQVALITVAQVAFGVEFTRSPAALAATVLTLSLLASSTGMLLATLFNTEGAMIAGTVIIALVMSAMGGAWFPLEITGDTFSTVAHLLPTAWIIDAFKQNILRGEGLTGIYPSLLVALGWSALLAVLAFLRLRSSFRT